MKTALFTVAAIAGAAAAQSFTLNITADDLEVEVNDTINFTVTADFEGSIAPVDGTFAYLTQFTADFLAGGTGGATANDDFAFGPFALRSFSTGFPPPVPAVGQVNGSYTGGEGVSSSLLGDTGIISDNEADFGTGLTIATFSVTATAEGTFQYSIAPNVDPTGAVAIIQNGVFNAVAPLDFFFLDDIILNSDAVTIVPAPGAAALLGLGGIAAIRRRR